MVTEFIKHFMHPLIDLVMKIGKMCAPVMITGIGQIKYFSILSALTGRYLLHEVIPYQ